MATISQLAEQLYDAFETAERPDGSSFTRLREGSPEWMTDAVMAAHDGGSIPPLDRLYTLTRDAAGAIADAGDLADDGHDFADGAVDYANCALAQWLADAPGHASACIEEWNEIGGEERDIFKQLQGGQYIEARNVYAAIYQHLEGLADDGEGEA